MGPVCVGKIRGSMVQASMYVFEDVDQVKKGSNKIIMLLLIKSTTPGNWRTGFTGWSM